ncbi:MAG: hypothetical protein WCF84_20695 [Anaerolineae bacterium]
MSMSLPSTYFTGRRLIVVQAAWLAVAILTIGLFALAVPPRFDQLQQICTGAACQSPQLSIEDIRQLQQAGLSREFHAAYSLGLELVFAAINFIFAALIFFRRSQDRVALLVSLMLMTFGPATFTGTLNALTHLSTGWQLPITLASSITGNAPDWLVPVSSWQFPVGLVIAIGQVATALFFFVFPDGRFFPRWGMLVVLVWSAWQVPAAFFPNTLLNAANWPPAVSIGVWACFLGSFIFAQVYRYRQSRDPVRRQQTKWVVFGAAGALAGYVVLTLLAYVATRLDLANLFVRQGILTLVYLVMVLIPLSFGLAILRSRLWDIDVIINRTLVYSVLTGTLALVYIGIVLLLQYSLRALTGQEQSAIVVAGSTLVTAALFTPLRERVQVTIDRRFYRRKYNAAQIMSAFNDAMRSEVDLDRLTGQLVAVVEETMKPQSVSLWLLERKDKEQ